jgi:hypothetical protein
LGRLLGTQEPSGNRSHDEIQGFLNRYAGTYQEDCLRNDWLLLLGKQRDWNTFSQVYPKFRMRDDKSVTCYALLPRRARPGRAHVGQQVRDLAGKRMPMTAAPRPPASCMRTS